MKFKIRSAVVAAAVSATSLVGLAAAPSAQACGLQTVGHVMEVVTTAGYDLGTFYQGYDNCQHSAYAEFHFKDLWVSSVATNSRVWIVSAARTDPGMTTYNPNGAQWWDAGKEGIYSTGNEDFEAGFYLSWNGYICQGYSDWYYGTGTQIGYGVGGPNCQKVGTGATP
ncbi:hypothetical protein GCM10009665_38310 [Kitasatospora nipponensis]|uniref:Peptidase inhibitor family I36 n=1 Tax=Kitasatospora nipponensis TaxID=258049 RepID=A0ABN1WE81_9ACTN